MEGTPRAVIVSLERLNRIRGVDVENFSMSADSGAVLQSLKDAAEARDMLFPLALGTQGSCQIGGNVSTNAGGINVLRYGMTREPLAYGHAGDGNIHFNVLPPQGMATDETRRHGSRVLEDLYAIAREFGGSFSAEHGVGRSRRDVHWDWLTPEQRAVSKALKAVFDPLGIMNPGSMLPEA
jgi:FAD/FMN-containing dehydrogenase